MSYLQHIASIIAKITKEIEEYSSEYEPTISLQKDADKDREFLLDVNFNFFCILSSVIKMKICKLLFVIFLCCVWRECNTLEGKILRLCISAKTCENCLQAGPSCAWCSDSVNIPRYFFDWISEVISFRHEISVVRFKFSLSLSFTYTFSLIRIQQLEGRDATHRKN